MCVVMEPYVVDHCHGERVMTDTVSVKELQRACTAVYVDTDIVALVDI